LRDGVPEINRLESLVPEVHGELRRLAARQLRHEAKRSLFQTAALVNEAYIRMAEKVPEFRDRGHFFAIAARVMRQILVDRARARGRAKRAGIRVSLSGLQTADPDNTADVIMLDDLLDRVAEFDERKARVVEMRLFAGMEVEEIASVIGVSANTVIRDWKRSPARGC
jgi:RNA polymerase sigma-70 factor, ECF subfamily